MKLPFQVIVDDLSGSEVQRLLLEHLADMKSKSPPESVHALDILGLRSRDVIFWSAWEKSDLFGCAALKELTLTHGEIKSMRTSTAYRRKGVAKALLAHVINEAKSRNYQRLSLETGSMDSFAAARALYQKFGFSSCPPFADYKLDPNSEFMTRLLWLDSASLSALLARSASE